MIFRKTAAFVKRDFLIETSYKTAFLFELLTSVLPVVSFYFIARLFASGAALQSLASYGGDYFSFVLVGVAFMQYFNLALGSFAGSIRRAQMAGCLEAMLSTRTRPETVIVLSGLYGFGMKTVHLLLIFILGGLLGARLGAANLLSVAVVLLLTIFAFSSFGVLAAALVLLTKKGDFVQWSVGSLGALLAGAFFPISVMPGWLRAAAHCIPMTYALEAMRLAALQGSSIVALWKHLVILAATASAFLPVSVFLFSWAVAKGRRDGTLFHY